MGRHPGGVGSGTGGSVVGGLSIPARPKHCRARLPGRTPRYFPAGNSYFGLAIGMVVTAMACSIGPVGGGAFNPAVGFMGFLFDHQQDRHLWIYWVACPLGAVLAACCCRVQNFEDFLPEVATDKSAEPEGSSSGTGSGSDANIAVQPVQGQTVRIEV